MMSKLALLLALAIGGLALCDGQTDPPSTDFTCPGGGAAFDGNNRPDFFPTCTNSSFFCETSDCADIGPCTATCEDGVTILTLVREDDGTVTVRDATTAVVDVGTGIFKGCNAYCLVPADGTPTTPIRENGTPCGLSHADFCYTPGGLLSPPPPVVSSPPPPVVSSPPPPVDSSPPPPVDSSPPPPVDSSPPPPVVSSPPPPVVSSPPPPVDSSPPPPVVSSPPPPVVSSPPPPVVSSPPPPVVSSPPPPVVSSPPPPVVSSPPPPVVSSPPPPVVSLPPPPGCRCVKNQVTFYWNGLPVKDVSLCPGKALPDQTKYSAKDNCGKTLQVVVRDSSRSPGRGPCFSIIRTLTAPCLYGEATKYQKITYEDSIIFSSSCPVKASSKCKGGSTVVVPVVSYTNCVFKAVFEAKDCCGIWQTKTVTK